MSLPIYLAVIKNLEIILKIMDFLIYNVLIWSANLVRYIIMLTFGPLLAFKIKTRIAVLRAFSYITYYIHCFYDFLSRIILEYVANT